MSNNNKQPKVNPKTIRLTAVANDLLSALAEKHGVSQTAILEMAIREKAERDGVSK